MSQYFAAIACLILAACNCNPDSKVCQERTERYHQSTTYRLYSGETVLITTAPDGTQLWATRGPDYRIVYFSTRGTSYTESHGKGGSRPVEVPNP